MIPLRWRALLCSKFWLIALVTALLAARCFAQAPQTPPTIDETVPPAFDNYPLGPDSRPQPGSPAGKTFSFELKDSKIFPGTVRMVSVYVPAEYKSDKPACVYVGLDSLAFNLPTVFDNLIAQHAMPVTIAIGLSSGTVESAQPPANPRFDRSFEFDSLSDRLVRFLLEEVLPAVEERRTPDGLPIRLSTDPNDRAIGGGSTGGIGAFTVAWQRPDAFRRVFTAIGTFVGMRGGEQYYVLVRKTEPKPIRIFMQDGVHDEWPGGPEMGDWWMSNQTMDRALEFAGYDVRHVWGAGTHNGSQATAIFPEAMRWLWRDWPAPIEARASGNPVLQAILQPGEEWKVAADGCSQVPDLAADSKGHVFYSASGRGQVAEVTPGTKPNPCEPVDTSAAFAFGPDGQLYRARAEGGLQVSSRPGGRGPLKVLLPEAHIQTFTVRHNGDIYAVTKPVDGESELWLIRAGSSPIRLDGSLENASGIALSPDGLWLMVAQRFSADGMSYRVLSDGKVDARAPFYNFYVRSGEEGAGTSELAMDRDGRAYAATAMGVEVFDRNGRVAAILPLPGNVAATSLCFGGPAFDTLYVAGGGKIYERKLKVAGASPWAAPVQLPPWNAG